MLNTIMPTSVIPRLFLSKRYDLIKNVGKQRKVEYRLTKHERRSFSSCRWAVAEQSWPLILASQSQFNYAATGRIVAIVRASPRLSSSPTSINFLTPNHSRRYLCRASATHDEEAAAKAAAINADNGAPTIFDKIIAKEIPSTIVYEDDKVLAFKDISPQAPVHVLVIPKFRDGLTQLGKAEQRHGEILGQLLYAARIVAEKEGILDGFRVVINNGPSACQSVYHLHLHVLGGRQMKWPPG